MRTYLIDDDPVSLFLTEQMLTLTGFTGPILSFNASEKALQHLLSHLPTEMPRLILLDLNMPLADGWAFLEALAPHEALVKGQSLIYLLTSSLALADEKKARTHRLLTGILHKPLNEQAIEDMVRQSQALRAGSS